MSVAALSLAKFSSLIWRSVSSSSSPTAPVWCTSSLDLRRSKCCASRPERFEPVGDLDLRDDLVRARTQDRGARRARGPDQQNAEGQGDAGADHGRGEKENPGGSPRHPPGSVVHVPTLAEQGVDKKTANLARKLSGLSGTERNAVAARDKTLAQVTREKTAAVREKKVAELGERLARLPAPRQRAVWAMLTRHHDDGER